MPPHQIFVDKQETAPETGSQSISGGSNHGKTRPIGNIMATEPVETGEDPALSAMKRQNQGTGEEIEEDTDSITSGLSSVQGAARMNSVHRRKLRQQLEKGTGVGGGAVATSGVDVQEVGEQGWKKAPTAGRAGNWREMYSVEVTGPNGGPAPVSTPEHAVEVTPNPPPVMHHVYVPHPGEEGGDLAGGTAPPTRMVVHAPPPPQAYDPNNYAMHAPPPPHHGHPHAPHGPHVPHPVYQQHYHHHVPPPPPGAQLHYGQMPPQGHDPRGHPGHHGDFAESYRNIYVSAAKPNFAGCNVRFGDLEIRVYERILGDNPSCSSGPPIGIGWNFYSFTAPPGAASNTGSSFRDLSDAEDDDEHGSTRSTRTELVVSLEKYERTRGPRCESHDLVLPRQTREELLVEAGYTRGQMAEAVRQNLKVKHQRRQTVTNIKLEDAEELVEKAVRSFKRMFLSGEQRRKSRTNHMYMEWLERSQHKGLARQQSTRRTQSILIESDEDKNRRNSQRGSTRQMDVSEGQSK